MDIKQDYREDTNLEPYHKNYGDYGSYDDNYVKWLEAKLTLTDVSQQRELLKGYAQLVQSYYTNHFFDDAVEESIDQFLSL